MQNAFVLRRATTGRPYETKVKSACRDDIKIMQNTLNLYALFAHFVVGVTGGRPLPVRCADKAKASCRRHC